MAGVAEGWSQLWVSAMPLTDCPHPLGGIIRVKERDFPNSPLVKAPLQGEQFRSLVGELRSHMSHVAKKNRV